MTVPSRMGKTLWVARLYLCICHEVVALSDGGKVFTLVEYWESPNQRKGEEDHRKQRSGPQMS